MFAKYRIVIILICVATILGSLIGYDRWRYSTAYNAGVEKSAIVCKDASAKALNDATASLKDELKGSLARYEKELESLSELNRRLSEDRSQTKVIYREIPKVVQSSQCRNLGMDVARVYNDIIGSDPKEVEGIGGVGNGSQEGRE
jgi:hypothetical protein